MRKLLILTAAMLLAAPSAMAADAGNGKTIFARCAICHTTTKGGPNGLGPNLFGVVGRKAASLPSYAYSGALKRSNITWTADKLKSWVMGPAKVVPGTKMTFAGISNPHQAEDVVAYLATLK
ncbi:MAG: cytochrome c family protein [Proteobacteria bacterium]|nr:cytochrome c family protein [Pseudomonadota bacterium]